MCAAGFKLWCSHNLHVNNLWQKLVCFALMLLWLHYLSMNISTSIQHSERPASSAPATTFLLLATVHTPSVQNPAQFFPLWLCSVAQLRGQVRQSIICCGLRRTCKNSKFYLQAGIFVLCCLYLKLWPRFLPVGSVQLPFARNQATYYSERDITSPFSAAGVSPELHTPATSIVSPGAASWLTLPSQCSWLAAFLSTAVRFLSILVWSCFSLSSL